MKPITLRPGEVAALKSAASTPCLVGKWDTVFAMVRNEWAKVQLSDLLPLYDDDRSREAVIDVVARSHDPEDILQIFALGGSGFMFGTAVIAAMNLPGAKDRYRT